MSRESLPPPTAADIKVLCGRNCPMCNHQMGEDPPPPVASPEDPLQVRARCPKCRYLALVLYDPARTMADYPAPEPVKEPSPTFTGTPTPPVRLKTLAEADAEVRELFERRQRVRPNGIACPNCGKELGDDVNGVVLTSLPPQVGVLCPACGWRGSRYVPG